MCVCVCVYVCLKATVIQSPGCEPVRHLLDISHHCLRFFLPESFLWYQPKLRGRKGQADSRGVTV